MAHNSNELNHGTSMKSSAKTNSSNRSYSKRTGAMLDANALLVSKTVQSLMRSGKLRFPRSGFILRMNRGRLIVQRSE